MRQNKKIIQAVILAGGMGTRISTATINMPKPLIKIDNKPFIFYLIKQLDDASIDQVLILSGYMSDEFDHFIKHFQNNFKCRIINIKSDPSLNTGARLISSLNFLESRFLLLYGDNYVPFNLKKYIKNYFFKSKDNFISAYFNEDNYSNSNISLDKNNYCTNYEKSIENEFVDIGYFILNKDDIDFKIKDTSLHLGREIIKPLISKRKLLVNTIFQKYYTVGTIERFIRFRDFINQSKTKFIFIDRDGVLNKKPSKGCYVTSYDQFFWKKGSLEALRILKKNNYKIVLITNQAGVARRKLSIQNLNKIHQKMCSEIRKNGGEIEYIYYCPHHWDEKCFCRKPEPGLLTKAAYELGIDLSKTLFFGDSDSDKEASEKVGTKFKLITEKNSLLDQVKKLFI